MRKVGLAAVALWVLGASNSVANVVAGPYPQTVTSRNGELLWYVGMLPVVGRPRQDMDAICQQVPISGGGWRAPWMSELETLMTPIVRTNAVGSWTELYLTNDRLFVPTVGQYVPRSRLHARYTFPSRDLFTYGGQPTTFERMGRGGMYHIHWFERHTQPWVSRQRSITHTPHTRPMLESDRLLCVRPNG